MKSAAEKLKLLEERGRLRSLRLPCGIDLTSNDYLGMASSDYLREVALSFFSGGGAAGAAGSRLLRGNHPEHEALEKYAASFFAAPAALFFANGFSANLSLFQCLPERRDVIVFDAAIHASARDGIQASAARHVRVPHNDLQAYENALEKAQQSGGRIWVAIESVYSMDGDFAPVEDLVALARRFGAVLVVDEAHATGIYGPQGRGLAYRYAAQNSYEDIIVLHTCGKALGVAGGLVCAPDDVVRYLINAARPFIYSTAPMPVQAHLVRKSLEYLGGAAGDDLRRCLAEVCACAKDLFGGSGTSIVPIVIGADADAVRVAELLQQKGYDIRAVRPPTVPEGTARLRLSLNAGLGRSVLEDFAADLSVALKEIAA